MGDDAIVRMGFGGCGASEVMGTMGAGRYESCGAWGDVIGCVAGEIKRVDLERDGDRDRGWRLRRDRCGWWSWRRGRTVEVCCMVGGRA